MRFYLCKYLDSDSGEEGYVFAKIDKMSSFSSLFSDMRISVFVFQMCEDCGLFKVAAISSSSITNNEYEFSTDSDMCKTSCGIAGRQINWRHKFELSELIFCTDDATQIKKKMMQTGLVLPETYKPVKKIRSLEIKNETNFSDEAVVGDIGNRFTQLTEVWVNFFGSYSEDKHSLELIRYSVQDESASCIYTDDSFEKWKKENFCINPELSLSSEICPFVNQKSKEEVYIAEIIDDMTIDITKVEKQISFGKCPKIKVRELYSMRYSLKRNGWCKRLVRKNWEDTTPTDIFNVNANNKKYGFEMKYLKNGSFSDFYNCFKSNGEFFEKIGYTRLLKNNQFKMSAEMLFIWFLIITYEYPALEILLKAGHNMLVENIISDVLNSANRQEILYRVQELEELVNPYATKESEALRLPSYILNYLKNDNCSIKDYLFWRDVYEIENLSLEQFQQIINSNEVIYYRNSMLCAMYDGDSLYDMRLQEIIKYDGYSLLKTIKYLLKQAEKLTYDKGGSCNFPLSMNLNALTDTLADTLKMSEELGVEIDKYPDALINIHNELAHLYNDRSYEVDDTKMSAFSELCEGVVKDVKSEKFVCVFPKNNQDFIQEGINQHNCVASYFRSVLQGDCIVFFIRKKENPEQSFITAEVRNTGLKQVMLSNNRRVYSTTDEYKFAKQIGNALNLANCDRRLGLYKKK